MQSLSWIAELVIPILKTHVDWVNKVARPLEDHTEGKELSQWSTDRMEPAFVPPDSKV